MKHSFSLLWALIFVASVFGCGGCKPSASKHIDVSLDQKESVPYFESVELCDTSGANEHKKNEVGAIDTNGDGEISTTEAERVVSLKIENQNADTLLELERFPNLERLEIRGVDVGSLVLSKNTKLKHLVCYNCNLTTLDLSKNVALEYVDCSSNQLTTLDLSKHTVLDNLYCDYNPLVKLYLANGHSFGHLSIPEDTTIIYKE